MNFLLFYIIFVAFMCMVSYKVKFQSSNLLALYLSIPILVNMYCYTTDYSMTNNAIYTFINTCCILAAIHTIIFSYKKSNAYCIGYVILFLIWVSYMLENSLEIILISIAILLSSLVIMFIKSRIKANNKQFTFDCEILFHTVILCWLAYLTFKLPYIEYFPNHIVRSEMSYPIYYSVILPFFLILCDTRATIISFLYFFHPVLFFRHLLWNGGSDFFGALTLYMLMMAFSVFMVIITIIIRIFVETPTSKRYELIFHSIVLIIYYFPITISWDL